MAAEIKDLKTLPPVQFTESALKEIKKLQVAQATTKPLRVGVKNGGCAGFSYIFEFDEPAENDVVYENEGLQIIINAEHEMYIRNLSVDFENGLNNRGFTFTNPNAQSTCGCGTSFA
jgi:iron-sulfur cluster assembly accessory protein